MIAPFGIILVFFGLVCFLAWRLGGYITIAMDSPESFFWLKPLRGVEKLVLHALGSYYTKSMSWKEYYLSLLSFHVIGILVLFLILTQATNLSITSAFNGAISFVTNTDWQAYIPESSLNWPVAALGLTTQLFFSAAVGFTMLAPLVRGFRGEQTSDLGNYWKDLLRFSLYVLLPLSTVLSVALVVTGVPQSVQGALSYTSFEGVPSSAPLNLCASFEAIKQLGTNGGGLFRANSAHPFENPTPFSTLLELAALLLIPIALCRTFGEMAKAPRQAILLIGVMGTLFVLFATLACTAESHIDPILGTKERSFFHAEGNMEGKECRIGPFWSVVWTVATTATSNGSVNCALSSLLPLTGGVPLGLMELGEVVFGGIGSGITGAIVFLLIAVFAAGLMVGRTPEYLGKKIEASEMKLIAILVILPATITLIGLALTLCLPGGMSSLSTRSAHGMTEALYAFSSAAANNGSSFAGLKADTPLYNIGLGLVMVLVRLGSAAVILRLAGALASKKRVAASPGTLPTDTFAFGLWYGFVILIVGALNFLPAFTLGPVIDHLRMEKYGK